MSTQPDDQSMSETEQREAAAAKIDQIVKKQLAAMAPGGQAEMIRLIEKVQERQLTAPAEEAVPFVLVGENWESGHAVASGQLVVRAPDDKSVDDVKAALAKHQYGAAPRRNKRAVRPDSRVLTVFRKGRSASELAEDIETLAKEGIVASYNAVLPLGQHTIKAGNLPVPAPGNPPPAPPAVAPSANPVRIAIVDTGIGPNRTDGWLDLVPRNGANAELLDIVPPANHLDFDQGHGTFVAGIVQRIAPGCEVWSYRFTGADGVGTTDDAADFMYQAVEDAERDGVRLIINASFGAPVIDGTWPERLREAVVWINSRPSEILMVAAVGNHGGPELYPASDPDVKGVAALYADYTPADFSGQGTAVDCATVGVGIISTFVEGTLPPVPMPNTQDYTFPPNAWAVWSGTSFACPQICAEVARLCLADPALTPQDGFAELLKTKRSQSQDHGAIITSRYWGNP